ncbi:MAG: peptide deformylase [Flavobacteriales bacterium]|nr:peptide deformylase [Flavobacteriales bacterium]
MIQAFGNSIYKTEAQPVGAGASAQELIAKLQEVQIKTKHPFVSAKHLGLNLQLFVIDLNFSKFETADFKQVFINPKLISTKAPLVSGLEDDLSLPRLTVSIDRPKQIEIRFLDENLTEQIATFSDLAARWILHGIDQMNGVSIIDKLNKHRQRSLKAHLNRLAEKKIESNYKLEYESERQEVRDMGR